MSPSGSAPPEVQLTVVPAPASTVPRSGGTTGVVGAGGMPFVWNSVSFHGPGWASSHTRTPTQ